MLPMVHLLLQEPDTEVLVSMLTSMEEVISVAGPELLSQERLGQALGAMQVRLHGRQLLPFPEMAPCCCGLRAVLHLSELPWFWASSSRAIRVMSHVALLGKWHGSDP
jgi:hypothetical protein